MMLPTRALVFIVAKQGYHFCRRGFGENKQQPMTSWPSILFTSTQSDSEHNIINDNYFLASGKNHVAATTSKNGLTRFNVKLKRTIFKRRRRAVVSPAPSLSIEATYSNISSNFYSDLDMNLVPLQPY